MRSSWKPRRGTKDGRAVSGVGFLKVGGYLVTPGSVKTLSSRVKYVPPSGQSDRAGVDSKKYKYSTIYSIVTVWRERGGEEEMVLRPSGIICG
jgi:hypothetical protein